MGNLYSEQRRVAKAELSFRQALALAPSGWDACASSNGLSNLLEASEHGRTDLELGGALGSIFIIFEYFCQLLFWDVDK